MTSETRVDLALPLLAQAPPGQVKNVYDDLLGLVASDGDAPDDDADVFAQKASQARRQYNMEQLIVVSLAAAALKGGANSQGASTILCQSGVHAAEPDRFISPRHKSSFKVNHITLETSDVRPYKANEFAEPLRADLEKHLSEYVKDRYGAGVVEVFAVPLPRQTSTDMETDEPEATTEQEEEAKNYAEGAEGVAKDNTDAQKVEEEAKEEAENKETGAGKDETEEPAEGKSELDDEMAAVKETEKKVVDVVAEEKEVEKSSTAEAKVSLPKEDEETHGETKLVIQLVANKYKLSNFWSGRWRSTYTLESSEASTLDASSNVHVHYFEEGNVQLHTSKDEQLNVERGSTTEATAKAIAKAIEQFEEAYQQELFKHCTDLSEGAFRALRRQLPMTRQKIDWDKVLNYKLGNELSKQ